MRVLSRHGLSDDDIKNMTEEERARSGLGREIDYELRHSDWTTDWKEISTKLRTEEDEKDVAARRRMVLAENASAEFPYPPKKIRSLLRRRRKDLERFSHLRYYTEMFGDLTKDRKDQWEPSVDKQTILKSMSAEAIHKQAFCDVEKNEQLQKAGRRRRRAQIVWDVPKYALIGPAVAVGLFVLGVAGDLLVYLPRSPTVVMTRRALSRLSNWLFTEQGIISALVVAFIVVVFMVVRKRLMDSVKDVA
jgi:hypothetical protein